LLEPENTNHSKQYDPKEIHYSYYYSLRVLRCFVVKRDHDPRWNDASGADGQFHFVTGPGG